MRCWLWLLPATAAIVSGCSRSTPSVTTVSNGVATFTNRPVGASQNVLPPPPPPVAARAENSLGLKVTGDIDLFLTSELQNFIQQQNRLPVSFAEFANLRLDSVPRPPPGKKWVIDRADLQVKAVAVK